LKEAVNPSMTFLMAGVSSSAAFTRSGASEVKPATKRNVKTTVRVVEWIHFIGNLLALGCAMLAQMSGLRIIQYAHTHPYRTRSMAFFFVWLR
jgi:hypothetical protein